MPAVAPPMAIRQRARRPRQRARSSPRSSPGTLSSLSIVPPVWPRPRPASMKTGRPQLASSGAITSDTLSPTPPVECLSQRRGTSAPRSQRSPESRMARVSARVSSGSRPRMAAAIRKAASCPSLQEPSAAPRATAWISSRRSRIPARLRSRMRYGRTIESGCARRRDQPGNPGMPPSGGRRSARRIERGHLLLGVRAQGGLRELVEDPLVGLDRLLGPVELLQGQAQLVQDHVLRQRRVPLLQHGPQLLDYLLALALLAVEREQVEAGLGGQHGPLVVVDEVAPQLAGLVELAGVGGHLRKIEAGHAAG